MSTLLSNGDFETAAHPWALSIIRIARHRRRAHRRRGGPLLQASLKALGREGVITSAGWKLGAELMDLSRSTECTKRHQHINTHYARFSEAVAAVGFAEEAGWLPPVDGERLYAWDEVPQLARDVEEGRVAS